MFGEQIAAVRAAINFLCGILHFKSLEKDGICHACGTPIPEGRKVFVVIPVDDEGREGEERPFCNQACHRGHVEKCSELLEQGQAA